MRSFLLCVFLCLVAGCASSDEAARPPLTATEVRFPGLGLAFEVPADDFAGLPWRSVEIRRDDMGGQVADVVLTGADGTAYAVAIERDSGSLEALAERSHAAARHRECADTATVSCGEVWFGEAKGKETISKGFALQMTNAFSGRRSLLIRGHRRVAAGVVVIVEFWLMELDRDANLRSYIDRADALARLIRK